MLDVRRSTFIRFFFDQIGRFSGRRVRCLPSEAWKAKGGHLTPET
jgi:hypothetical protein